MNATSNPTSGCSLARRALAFSVDAACAALPVYLAAPLIIAMANSADGAARFAASSLVPVAIALSILTYLGAHTIQALRRRQTPGQRLARVHVTRAGQPPTRRRMLARELGARLGLWALCAGSGLIAPLGAGLLPLLALDALWTVADPQRRSLRDRLTGTSLQQRA